MRKKDESKFKLGDYYLTLPRWKVWAITWYDAKIRQTRTTTTGTRDFEEAKIALAQFYVDKTKDEFNSEEPEQILLSEVLNYYLTHYAMENDRLEPEYYVDTGEPKDSPATQNVKYHTKQLLDFFGEDALLSDVTRESQKRFIKFQRRRLHKKPASINRILSTARSAINFCLEEEVISKGVKIKLEKCRRSRRHRTLSAEEVAKLFMSCETDHTFHYLVLALCTAGRPGAILDLSKFSIKGNIIDLLPADKEQKEQKLRPELPMCQTLRRWIEHMPSDGPFVQYRGKKIACNKKTFARTVERAGLSKDVHRYTLRHTIASVMGAKNVSVDRIGLWLGHVDEDQKMTAWYLHQNPDWLADATQAIDDFFEEIISHIPEGTTGLCSKLRPSCVPVATNVIPFR